MLGVAFAGVLGIPGCGDDFLDPWDVVGRSEGTSFDSRDEAVAQARREAEDDAFVACAALGALGYGRFDVQRMRCRERDEAPQWVCEARWGADC
jgi:hypothetical protein